MFDNDFELVPWDIFEKIVRFDGIWGKKEAIWSVLNNAGCCWGCVWVHFLELGWYFGKEWKVFLTKISLWGESAKFGQVLKMCQIFPKCRKISKNSQKIAQNSPILEKNAKKSLIFNDFWGQNYRIFKNRKNMVKNCLKNLKKLHFLQFLHIFKC